MLPNTAQNANQGSSHHPNYHMHQSSFRKQHRGATATHPNLSSYPVTPQDNSADPRLYERTRRPDCASQTLPHEQRIGTTTFQDIHNFNHNTVSTDQQNVNSRGTQYIGPGVTAQLLHQPMVTMFQDAQNLNFSGNARIMNIGRQYVNTHGNYSLDKFERFVSFSALHDSSAQDPERCCHPRTRESVLRQIRDWVDNPSKPERILWLYGPAGVGKSAIAQTISNSYDRDKVGGTFFFFRSDPMRNDGNRLFPTLTWQLASSIPMVKDFICFSLEEYPDLPTKAVEVQFNKLIAQPLLTVSGDDSTVATSRVIIIDGLDECSDMNLQERILKIIGNSVVNTRFPLRFIISCRPEANIQNFFHQFRSPILRIDLANVENAFRDIKKYIISKFARIAFEQRLDPRTWPGRSIIDTLVSKSSGQFVYASTVMEYVGDKFESAVTRLDVILGLKPSDGRSPFSELGVLYQEVLQRQPDQIFLKEFLPVLVARSMLSGTQQGSLHEDDAMLLGLDKVQLHKKLQGMHSVLKFEPFIDIHHKSFLDFLDDPSRSGEYHVSKRFANKRYVQRIVDLLAKAASRAMEQPEHPGSDHFQPRFSRVIRHFPLPVELPLHDLEEILPPLQFIQENMLQSNHISLPLNPTTCNKCWTFYLIDDLLLHLSWFRGTIHLWEPKYVGVRPLTELEAKQGIPQLDLDVCLSLLLARLKRVEVAPNADIGLVRALVLFDPAKTAMKIRSRMDAQNLVDLIFCLNKNGCFKSWFGVAAQNATKLALAIYKRVPVLPRRLFLNSADLDRDKRTYQGKSVYLWSSEQSVWKNCLDALFQGCLSHDNLCSLLGIFSTQSDLVMVLTLPENRSTMDEWLQNAKPSVSSIQRIFFEIAKAIQYLRSLGVTDVFMHQVYVDSDTHPKMLSPGFPPIGLCKERFIYEGYYSNDESSMSCQWFGAVLYCVLQDHVKASNPSEYNQCHHAEEPKIPTNLWQLIQRCCAEEPKKRPTIDQVVQEMESWISLGQFTLSS